ncbi:zinc finger protein 800b isoform X2 [Gadus morhua]|nr:zinc finger protein 800 isoform X2 [Gadus morhua]
MDAELEEEKPKRGSPSPDPPQPKAQAPVTASPESQAQECSPEGNPEKGDCSGQTKALWKPIPPLQPQDGPGHATKDQSCQTEERLQDSQDPCSHTPGHCIEPGDPPLLQKPLQTSKSGIQQIIECFQSGTSELKQMLLREVDTIFECKLCRSLFRGLPNLITHREYYCISSQPPDADGDDGHSVAVKELVQALYPRKEHPDQVVRLEPIGTSTKAVFQYLTTEEELACSRHNPGSWVGEQPEEEEEEEEEMEEEEEEEEEQEQQTCEPESRSGKQSPGPPAAPKRRAEPEKDAPKAAREDPPPAADEDSSHSGVEDVTISCCLCGKDFNSRRSIRRHCRKMHQSKLEELRKFTETRTIPFSLVSVVKGRPKTLASPVGAKSCPVCKKNFATKANVRRHFDEVHRGLRRDLITPENATRPGHLLSLEDTPPRKPGAAVTPPRVASPKPAAQNPKSSGAASSSSSSTPAAQSHGRSRTPNQTRARAQKAHKQQQAAAAAAAAPTQQYSISSCRCMRCKKTYSSQVMLKRHMRIVHKVSVFKKSRGSKLTRSQRTNAKTSAAPATANRVHVKEEARESSEEEEEEEEEEAEAEEEEEEEEAAEEEEEEEEEEAQVEEEKVRSRSTPPPGVSHEKNPRDAPAASAASGRVKNEEETPSFPADSSSSPLAPAGGREPPVAGAKGGRAPRLSVGFDFKQLFCKLCKRQFSSRQNLTKHIELHTDGNEIFIKFYRCPLCRYESRRKRDVLRHVTVVHKQPSAYLAKIVPKLESRAVKRPAEVVLTNTTKRPGGAAAAGGKSGVNGRHAASSSSSAASSNAAPQPRPPSPPVTRKQDQLSAAAPPPVRRQLDLSPAAAAAAACAPAPPVTRTQDRQQQRRPSTPPLTRQSDKGGHPDHGHAPSSAGSASRSNDAPSESGSTGSTSTEVKVTQNFSLHACDQCGRAFAKKLFLESHKRSHRNAAAVATRAASVGQPESRRKGVSTRSKSLLC